MTSAPYARAPPRRTANFRGPAAGRAAHHHLTYDPPVRRPDRRKRLAASKSTAERTTPRRPPPPLMTNDHTPPSHSPGSTPHHADTRSARNSTTYRHHQRRQLHRTVEHRLDGLQRRPHRPRLLRPPHQRQPGLADHVRITAQPREQRPHRLHGRLIRTGRDALPTHLDTNPHAAAPAAVPPRPEPARKRLLSPHEALLSPAGAVSTGATRDPGLPIRPSCPPATPPTAAGSRTAAPARRPDR